MGYWGKNELNFLIPLAPFALIHFYRVFFPLRPGEIAFDERDEVIMHRASRWSFILFWYAFILSCLVPLILIGNGRIHVMYLGWMVFAGAVLLRLTWSVAVILQYGRTKTEDAAMSALNGGLA